MRRWRLRRHERQLEVVDDTIDNREICKEGNDAHPAAALGTDKWVDFINLADHLGPAPAGNPWAFLLDNQETMLAVLRLAQFAPMSVGVQAELC